MSYQAALHHFGETRFMLTQGRFAKAAHCAEKCLKAAPEHAVWLFVAGSIEAARFWMSRGDRSAAMAAAGRVFNYEGPYDFSTVRPELLEPVEIASGESHRAAALDYLGRAGQLGGEFEELVADIALTARELAKDWSIPPAPVLASDEICLLDVSIQNAPGVLWVNDLPKCPLVMLSPHWAQFTTGQLSPVVRKLRDALLATKRLRQEAVPSDVGRNADLILDQLWRRGSACDITVVTDNIEQARAADGLRNMAEGLDDPQTAPIKRKLRLVRPLAKLPDWQLSGEAARPPRIAHLPGMSAKSRPVFSAPVNDQVFVDFTPIEVAPVGTGSVVRTGSNDYRRLISKPLGFGGEGYVYQTDGGDVCKAYQPGKATVATLKKLQLMVKRQIGHPLVCWPKELVYLDGKFVGYLMPRAQGQIMKTVTTPEKIPTVFPNWTRRDVATLALQVCEIVEYLHRNNIVIGDLSDTNIMVDGLAQPWFIDTDSYQFGSFPSPVGRRPFIHPDLLGKDLKATFRLMEHEWFALATLVFMILLPGRPPYFGAGADNPDDDHRDRIFPYRMAKVGDPRLAQRDMQLGPPWIYIWSNLPTYLRQAFWAVFREAKEKIAALAPAERSYDATVWRDLLQRYVHELQHSTRLSNELFPARYRLTKPKPDEERRVCENKDCKHEFNVAKAELNGRKHMPKRLRFCGACLNTLLSFPCDIVQSNGKPCKRKHLVRFRDYDERNSRHCAFHQSNPP